MVHQRRGIGVYTLVLKHSPLNKALCGVIRKQAMQGALSTRHFKSVFRQIMLAVLKA
jgi:hypothetical protein